MEEFSRPVKQYYNRITLDRDMKFPALKWEMLKWLCKDMILKGRVLLDYSFKDEYDIARRAYIHYVYGRTLYVGRRKVKDVTCRRLLRESLPEGDALKPTVYNLGVGS